MSEEPLLKVEELTVHYRSPHSVVRAVNKASISIEKGECIALVGESGSGKSTLALAVVRLLPPNAEIVSGKVLFGGTDLLRLSERDLAKIRGRRISMIFQDPVSYLNPVLKVGDQLAEAILTHSQDLTKREAYEEAIKLLTTVRIPDPDHVLKMYPFQLSGGMAQRVFIATALATRPDLLIADEPTTALDVTVQAQILKLLKQLREELNLTLMLITHDLGIVSCMADRVYVMYMGRVVEEDLVDGVYEEPAHPYTKMLMGMSKMIYESTRPDWLDDFTKAQGEQRSGACEFIDRCPRASAECVDEPPYVRLSPTKWVRCWLYA